MDFSNAGADLLINIIAGILGAMIVLFVVERRRRPNLTIVIEPDFPKLPQRNHLRVLVTNQNLYPPLSLIYDREPALMCRAWISFYYTDGTRVYPREMVARWAKTPEPLSPIHEVKTNDGRSVFIANEPKTQDWVDIAAGETTALDIVLRFNNESDCFGWNNDGYARDFRNTDWKLGQGRYHVKIRIETGGREFSKSFQLINDVDFRLEDIPDVTANIY